jgi:Ca-activated chloride channel family protein
MQDFNGVNFGQPLFLWLLALPGVLLVVWSWRLALYRRDRRAFRRLRRTPVAERLPVVGGLLFWLFLLLATASTVVALARPLAAVPLVRSAGADIVILQDGSASMRVRDVGGDRWQRSVQFLRTIGESLRWKDDRIALALFAHLAEPQIRLTKDPNTYFFFLDHLARESPFRLEDDPTWDTNIEQGVYWGMRLIEKDEQLHGRSPNGKIFVLVSDGQVWSGEVARALELARNRGIPIFVVGVGTAGGGLIPEPQTRVSSESPTGERSLADRRRPLIHAALDRDSLAAIAKAGGGQYMELGRQSDRDIANRLISAARRAAGPALGEPEYRDLYWPFLVLAACLLGAGSLFMQERSELWLYALGTGAALVFLWTVTS